MIKATQNIIRCPFLVINSLGSICIYKQAHTITHKEMTVLFMPTLNPNFVTKRTIDLCSGLFTSVLGEYVSSCTPAVTGHVEGIKRTQA